MDATIQLAVIRTTEAALFDVERTVCRGRGKLLGSRRIYMRVWLQYISWEQCVHKLSLYPHRLQHHQNRQQCAHRPRSADKYSLASRGMAGKA